MSEVTSDSVTQDITIANPCVDSSFVSIDVSGVASGETDDFTHVIGPGAASALSAYTGSVVITGDTSNLCGAISYEGKVDGTAVTSSSTPVAFDDST